MAEPKKGTPLAAAHLRPEVRGQAQVVQESEDWPKPGEVRVMDQDLPDVEMMIAGLVKLREPFADDQIEKLPKPMWKGAWDGQKGSQCSICNGYHVTQNCLHLDYVGHANATNRLLDADLTWNWEPMAYTEAGTPLFTDNGLWIKLTVCGVTRIGYGDGKTVKEVIGDAIRNAAMRFGVALDLWAKINLHEERNPGDGQTQQVSRGRRDEPRQGVAGAGGRATQGENQAAAPQPRAANQDALDALATVCDREGYDRRAMATLYREFAKRVGKGNIVLVDAPDASIREFTVDLVERAYPDTDASGDSGDAAESVDSGAGDGAGSEAAVEVADESVPADPEKIF